MILDEIEKKDPVVENINLLRVLCLFQFLIFAFWICDNLNLYFYYISTPEPILGWPRTPIWELFGHVILAALGIVNVLLALFRFYRIQENLIVFAVLVALVFFLPEVRWRM